MDETGFLAYEVSPESIFVSHWYIHPEFRSISECRKWMDLLIMTGMKLKKEKILSTIDTTVPRYKAMVWMYVNWLKFDLVGSDDSEYRLEYIV